MKRVLVIILCCAVLPALRADGAGAAPAGNVVLVRGTAAIVRGEQERPAKTRDAVAERDLLTTGERSRLKVLFRNDSIMTLGSNGRLAVRKYLESPEQKRTESVFELADGKLRTVVGSGSFKITTPTAYAAARGTVFVLWYDPVTSTTGIAVIEGGVEIRNVKHGDERAVILVAGQMSRITGSEGPTPPEPFSLDIWGAEGDTTPMGQIKQELADLGEQGNDEQIGDTGSLIDQYQQDQGGGQGQGDGTGGPAEPGGPNDPFTPPVPVIEPPIDQQPPPPPVTAPITVSPVFP